VVNWKRSSVLRKSVAAARGAPRAARRLIAREADYRDRPPVLANSFPKSGTHLLLQILETLPGVTRYGSFLASQPSVRFRERSSKATLRRIRRFAPGELVAGHLFHAPAYARALGDRHVIHYFIYRDPRDVVVSEAAYLARMNRWHRLHRHFRALATDEERIAFSIMGDREGGLPVDYPDVAARFRRYAGWLDDPKVHAVRFEDLMGEKRESEVGAIVDAYLRRSGARGDPEPATRAALEAIRPETSHTFRRSGTGGWQEVFSERHRTLMRRVAGDLLIDLGYEQDLDW
jgi:hypothetical protein